MTNNFVVKTKDFEGPFSLLLEFIQKKKLDINDISLYKITDDYIKFIRENQFKLYEVASFVNIAATLMLIKSRKLLPQLIITEEEEIEIDELKKHLLIMKIFNTGNKEIKKNFGKKILYKKLFKKNIEIKFRPSKNINIKNILISIDELVGKSTFEKPKEIKKLKPQISLKEVIEKFSIRIKKYLKMNFSDLNLSPDRKDTSVSFLAILELFKNNEIDLQQEQNFEEIIITSKIR